MKNRIVTHSGLFHADDILATAMLLGILLKWPRQIGLLRSEEDEGDLVLTAYHWVDGSLEDQLPLNRVGIFRTRNPEVISEQHSKGAYVLDVGGVHDPENRQFDHHQGDLDVKQHLKVGEESKEFEYSSLGLLCRADFEQGYPGLVSYLETVGSDELPEGTRSALLGLRETGLALDGTVTVFQKMLEDVSFRIWERLIARVDGQDTGTWPIEEVGMQHVYTVQSVISGYNPTSLTSESMKPAFRDALNVAYAILRNIMRRTFKEAADLILLKGAMSEAGGNRVLVLDQPLNWGKLPELDDVGQFLFVVFPTTDDPGSEREWMIQTVPEAVGSFIPRKQLPAPWAALRGEDLAKVCGVEDANFCHKGLWIGGAHSKAGAEKMADYALDAVASSQSLVE